MNKEILRLIENFEAIEGWRDLKECIDLILAIKEEARNE